MTILGFATPPQQTLTTAFSSYYQTLYSSRVAYTPSELDSYLGDIDFPILTGMYREKLDVPITVKEVQRALGSIQVEKTPGWDGISVEFYKAYADELVPQLHSVMVKSLTVESFSTTMSEAVILVIPKAREGPRPVLLLSPHLLTQCGCEAALKGI